MQTEIISGPDYITEALFGIGLSYGLTSNYKSVTDIEDSDIYKRLVKVSRNLANKPGGGHNKFLETVTLTLDVRAPRYWWQEFDTYRVGMTKQSESTMHTIMARPLTEDDFEGELCDGFLLRLNEIREKYLYCQEYEDESGMECYFDMIKNNLPEGYLQRRIVCLNAKSLKNMYEQRKSHRLKQWAEFFDGIKAGLDGANGELFGEWVFGGNK